MIRRLLHAARRDQQRGRARALHHEILGSVSAPPPEQRCYPDAFDGHMAALTRAEEEDDPAAFVLGVDALFCRWPHLRACPSGGALLEQRASAAALVALRGARRGARATYPARGGRS